VTDLKMDFQSQEVDFRISKLGVIKYSLKTANLVIILFKGFACRSLSLVKQGVADFKPVSILFP